MWSALTMHISIKKLMIYDKSTQRAQTSCPIKGAHYPHITWLRDLDNQHGVISR